MSMNDDRAPEPSPPPALTGSASLVSRAPTPLASYASTPILNAALPGSGNASSPDLLTLLRALRRRWKSAFVLGLFGTSAVALLTWYFLPAAQYTTEATIQVMQEEPRVIFNTNESHTRFEVFQQTQKALLKSRMVLGAVLSNPKIASLLTVVEAKQSWADPIDWLEKVLLINFPPNSEILQISLSGERPGDLAEIVNAITDTYMNLVIDESYTERVKRLEDLRKLWDTYQQGMKAKRDKVKALAQTVGSDDRKTLAMKQQLSQQQLAMINQQELQLEADLMRLQAEVATRKNRQTQPEAAEIDPAIIDQYVEKDPKVEHAREMLRPVETRYEEARRRAKKLSDPSVVKYRKDLEELTKDLESLRAETRIQVARQLRTGSTAQPGEESRLDEKIQILKAFQTELKNRAKQLTSESSNLSEKTIDLQTEQDEIALLTETATKVGREVEVTDVELKAPKRVKVIDRAKVPQVKDQKRKYQVTALASMATLAFVLFGVSFREIRARRISSVDEVINGLGLRVVGALPALPTPSGRRSSGAMRPVNRDWENLLVESVDATRAMLLYTSRMENLHIVLVTSAQTGEGKTSLASHLAASLARAGRKTLLVDCDFRRPAIHRLFDLPTGPGICEVLRGEAHLADVLQPSPANHLTVLTAGQADSQAMESLGHGDLQPIFDELKTLFDFIIVDSAPILPVADTLLISQHIDVAIFAIMHEVSRIPLVQAAYQRLAGLGVPILGAVVAGTSEQAHYYGSGYYYRSDKTAQAS